MNIESLDLQQKYYRNRGYLNYRDPLYVRALVDYHWRDHAVPQLGPYQP